MVANIDVAEMVDNLATDAEGRAAFMAVGEPAWHGLGTVHPAGTVLTTAEALESAYLAGWNLRLVPAGAVLSGGAQDGAFISVDGQFALIRDNPMTQATEGLSIVGSKYAPIQNEEAFAWVDGILDGGGSWETAGAIQGGRKVFGSLAIDREVVIDPSGAADAIRTFLLVVTSHDGTLPTTGLVTPVRVVCQNTLNQALRGTQQQFKVRHTKNFADRMRMAREALGITFRHMDAFEAEARALYETAVTSAEFSRIVTNLYPEPGKDASKAAQTRWSNLIDLIGDIYTGSVVVDDEPQPDLIGAGIRGTAWGAYNALEARLDHYRQGRGDRQGDAQVEAVMGLAPAVQAEKARIYDAVRAFAAEKSPAAAKVLVSA